MQNIVSDDRDFRGRTETLGQKADRLSKVIFDKVMAVLLLPLIAPIIAILYGLTRLDGGPGFFGHARVGRNGETFRCWKIRTMVPNAQAVLARHLARNPAAAAEWARDFKLTDDPRVTPLGRFLRRTSLDELPQIWNVLLGEMSFVGPRPVTAEELSKYQTLAWCYLTIRPGITGLWQISGRNDVSYDERVQLDALYRTTRTFLGDVGILLRTMGAVVGQTGR